MLFPNRLRGAVVALLWTAVHVAAQRFPHPEFESGYTIPDQTLPHTGVTEYLFLDTIVLIIAMLLATWFALKLRRRLPLLLLAAGSAAYFGFWRKGCICAIGSIQNISLAVFDSSYVLPLSAALFFVIPLGFALFAGRVFCGSVCPLGALQDLCIVKPMALPAWLLEIGRGLRILYLGAAVLLAATGAGFLICRFDPFIGFFRLGASAAMFLFGVALLAVGTVIARPYCRFLCPYSILLGWVSRLSRRHLTITPDDCVQCRLCERSCPFGAIELPSATAPSEPVNKTLKRLRWSILLLPVLAAAGAATGYLAGPSLSLLHPDVRLAALLHREERRGLTPGVETDTWRRVGSGREHLREKTAKTTRIFQLGACMTGAFFGLVYGARLLGLSIPRPHDDYRPSRSDCLSCGRCFSSCPHERLRRSNV